MLRSIVLAVSLAIASAQPVSFSRLDRAAFWEGVAEVVDGALTIAGADAPMVDVYGPRLNVGGAFRLAGTLQAVSSEQALLTLVADDNALIGIGLQDGQAVLHVRDASWTFDVDAPQGPLSFTLERAGNRLSLALSGASVVSVDAADLPAQALLGATVAPGNALIVHALTFDGPPLTRCAPSRLLVAGADPADGLEGLWWVWPDDDIVRPIERSPQRSFLIARSPDERWVSYYKRSSTDLSDRFVVDAWVIDVATDERYKLVEDGTPRAWNANSLGVVLGERPFQMALVPSGELVPTEGPLVAEDGMRSLISPDGQRRATVATSSRGSVAVELFDVGQSDPFMSIPTGLGPIQLAWSPDSARLAYTSSMAGQDGIVWRLRMVDVAERSVAPVESTRGLALHAVVWVPPLGGC